MAARHRDRIRAGASLLLALCLVPAAAAGDPGEAPAAAGALEAEPHPPGFAGWSPALAAGVGVHLEEFNGSVNSSFGLGEHRKRVLSSLELRFDARLLAPAVALPWRPRPLLHAGIGVPMRSSSTLLSRSQLIGPTNQSQGENREEISVDWHLSWFAGIGLQFQLPIGYDVRLTPSLDYFGSRLGYGAAVSTQAPPHPITNPFPPRIVLEGSPDSSVRHFFGPQLAGEFVFLRVGRSVLSLYLDGQLYWNLGDRESRFSFSGPVNGVVETAAVRIESGRVVSRIGFGLRGGY